MSATLLSQFNRQLSTAAPAIDLKMTPATRFDLAQQIDLGRIDVANGAFRSAPEWFRTRPVLPLDEVFVRSGGHSIGDKTLQLAVLVKYPAGRGAPGRRR